MKKYLPGPEFRLSDGAGLRIQPVLDRGRFTMDEKTPNDWTNKIKNYFTRNDLIIIVIIAIIAFLIIVAAVTVSRRRKVSMGEAPAQAEIVGSGV